MQRRDFVAVAGAVAAAYPMRNAECGMRNRSSTGQFRTPHSAFRISGAQEPSLSPEVFARRLDRARGELKARGLDLLIATPSTSYEYLTGYNPRRSDRLIALLLPAVGGPAIVCPSFEVERIKRHSIVTELHGWEEQGTPMPWCAKPSAGSCRDREAAPLRSSRPRRTRRSCGWGVRSRVGTSWTQGP